MQSKKAYIDKIPMGIWTPNDLTDPTKSAPLVVCAHGLGEIGDGSDASLTQKIINNGNFGGIVSRGDRLGYRILMPQLVLALNSYVPTHSPDYINKTLKYAIDNYNIDQNRIYFTGLSMGGGSVWQYACSSLENANRVAALIPICGTWSYVDWSLIGKSNVPVWAYHAADDGTVSVNATRQAINGINAYSPKPVAKYTEYTTGGHSIWSKVYNTEELYTWMMAQVNTNVITDPVPVPEPFKPTHRIVNAKGEIEEVKIIAI